MKSLAALFVTACAALLGACSTPDAHVASAASTQPVGAVIVKPKTPVANDAALVTVVRQKLNQPERVSFLRPMSGGAYVFNVVSPATANDIPGVISDLLATGLFEYVEEDQIVTIQK
jgi:hypothetical protein